MTTTVNGGMHKVQVNFADPKHNYTTSVSPQATEQNANEYFVGKWFNIGSYPTENMQQCTSIVFTHNSNL